MVKQNYRVLLLSDFQKYIAKSGVGQALNHQRLALERQGINYTLNYRGDYDLIHINTTFPTSFVKAKLNHGKVPIIYHAHSTEEDFRDSFISSNLISPQYRKWLEICYNTADLILTPSQYSKQLLKNYRLFPPIEVISNGVDLDYWQADAEEVTRFRAQYCQPDRKLIISVGLTIERKGLFDFVDMAKAMPDNQFVWFGYTNPSLLPHEVTEVLNSSWDNLTFPGYLDHKLLRLAYQAADLYVFPTLEETEGIVLLEALASRTPTLVRDLPVFAGYQDGLHLHKAQNLQQFIQKAQAILQGQMRDTRQAGYEKVSEYSIDNIGRQLGDFYEACLEKFDYSALSR